CQQHNSHSLTF
nr:immunoglobulin light chain junction region [Macaca mulatta]